MAGEGHGGTKAVPMGCEMLVGEARDGLGGARERRGKRGKELGRGQGAEGAGEQGEALGDVRCRAGGEEGEEDG